MIRNDDSNEENEKNSSLAKKKIEYNPHTQ